MGQFILKHSWVTQKNTWHTGRCPEYKYYNYFVKYSWEQGSSGRVRKLRPLSFRLLTIPVLVSTWFSLIFLIKFKKKKFSPISAVFRATKGSGFFSKLAQKCSWAGNTQSSCVSFILTATSQHFWHPIWGVQGGQKAILWDQLGDLHFSSILTPSI